MQSILIIRLSAIGDIVMASALISPLRQKYPNSHIYWLAQPECKSLLEHHPDLAGVIIWDKRTWQQLWKTRQYLSLWRTIKQFRQKLKKHQFDCVLDLQGLLKSGLLAWLSGAKKRIGLGSKEGSQHLMHQVLPRNHGNIDWIGSEYRYLAGYLELQHTPWKMHIGLDTGSQQAAAQLIQQHQLQNGFIVICPFTTRPQKHWFNEQWQQLVTTMDERWRLPIVLLGGPADQVAAEKIMDGIKLINLVGQTSLLTAAALIARSRLLVGVDTGLTHMGHMHTIPTIALFGSTKPYLKVDSPYSHMIYHEFSCSPCKRNPTCDGRFDCMQAITVEEIIKNAELLMHKNQQTLTL